MNNAIGMQNSLESILNVLKSIISGHWFTSIERQNWLFSWLWWNLKGVSVLWSCLSSSSCLPQCCLFRTSLFCRAFSLFGVKLLFMLFMLLIAFQVLLSKIKLHMSTFSGHFQTITTFTPSILLVSFFFNHMSITNLSLGQGFVVSWLWWNSKGVLVLWSYLSSSSCLPQCCLLGTSLFCRAFSLSCLPIFLLCFRSFSRRGTYSFCSCSRSSCSCSWFSCRLLCPTTRYLWPLS